MTEAIVYTLIAVLAVSAISLVGLFLVPERLIRIRSLILFLIGVSVGALLGDAFIHLIPESLEELGGLDTGLWILGGLGIFFVFEKFLHWHHHHELHITPREECDDCDTHIAPFGKLIIAADALHNVTDGAIIAAGFLISVEAGIATTIAVALHEIPQEVGDFGALLHAGYSRMRALAVNFASALSAFVGAVAVFMIGSSFEQAVPIIAALTAGSFIYIAIADLVPELHKSPRLDHSFAQLAAVVLGVGLMVGLTTIENGGHGHGEEHGEEANLEYSSSELGLSFEYPDHYFVTEREVGDAHRTHYSTMLVEDTPFNRDLVAGKIVGTEGPTAITIDAYQNNLDSMTTEGWVRGTNDSNYKLSPDGALTPVIVGGKEGLKYRWSGLYEADNIAVATPENVFSFVVTYLTLEDVIRSDFEEVMETVQFE